MTHFAGKTEPQRRVYQLLRRGYNIMSGQLSCRRRRRGDFVAWCLLGIIFGNPIKLILNRLINHGICREIRGGEANVSLPDVKMTRTMTWILEEEEKEKEGTLNFPDAQRRRRGDLKQRRRMMKSGRRMRRWWRMRKLSTECRTTRGKPQSWFVSFSSLLRMKLSARPVPLMCIDNTCNNLLLFILLVLLLLLHMEQSHSKAEEREV